MRRAAALWIVFLALLYRRAEERRLRLPAPRLRILARVTFRALAAIPPDILRVGQTLVRSLYGPRVAHAGIPSNQPFRHGNDSAEDAARRAMVVLGTSLAPNGYVLMMPEGSEAMVLHRLALVPPKPDREWPV